MQNERPNKKTNHNEEDQQNIGTFPTHDQDPKKSQPVMSRTTNNGAPNPTNRTAALALVKPISDSEPLERQHRVDPMNHQRPRYHDVRARDSTTLDGEIEARIAGDLDGFVGEKRREE
ncbi:hypothetical protein Sjap_023061 [Stephania japonica]|uniref:Uncharacterized protein n=1 Tax=Stephania japonica TaxID=461633 RepID=A0AAP0EQI9_9MAGN